jgi:lipopolysaccharide export system protein LptA
MRRSLWIGLLLLAALPAAGQAPELAEQTRLPIDLNAGSSEFDRRNNRLVFRSLTITQGTLNIRADSAEATRLDFDNSRWMFQGNVVIDNQGARIWCDRAELTFAGHQLRRALLTGEPARFEQQRPPDQRTEGHAGAMEYDVDAGVIRLTSNARISDGANEVSGERISYDLRREYVIADAGDAGQVRMKIKPPPRKEQDEAPP